MAIFRNDFGEDRVVPHIGYQLVPAGSTVTVPDDEAHHWAAGGWTRVDDSPAAAPAKTKKAVSAAEEGGE